MLYIVQCNIFLCICVVVGRRCNVLCIFLQLRIYITCVVRRAVYHSVTTAMSSCIRV